jgi:predicted membrane protein
MAPGTNIIEITAIFGGMKLIIPDDWHVKVDVLSIFGGITDKHKLRVQNPGVEPESELLIKGVVVFGGGEIISF